MTRARPTGAGAAPLRLWREVVVGLALFALYVAVDSLHGPARHAAALRHGRDLLSLEERLHLDIEQPLNSWLAAHPLLATLADYEYAWTYVLSALALLAWVWRRRRDLWRSTRDSFILLNLLAFACFALYPTAPPRMLPDLGFIDTVSRGATVGSWGSGLVDSANQVAAMPSLHVGWALWVSVVLARITARRSVQLLSGGHVLLTAYVIIATANHYVVDALAVVVPVMAGVYVAERRHGRVRPSRAGRRRRTGGGEVVPACDAFFLHVEQTGAAQVVGGLVLFAPASGEPRPDLAAIRELARTELVPRTRFHQRLAPPSRWRRPRWVDVPVDIDEHVLEVRSTDGLAGLHALVARQAEAGLPRDRPPWRILVVRDVEPGRSALLLLVHHAMADGIGTVTHALRLFRPLVPLPEPSRRGPGRLRRGLAIMVGLAQLARDGSAGRPGEQSPDRDFATARLDLEQVRAAARERGVRVTDLVLAVLGEAVHATGASLLARTGDSLRVSVTQMVRAPGDGSQGGEGNATAAVMVEVPVDDRPLEDRLAAVSRTTARLRTPTRALASRFVMATGLRLLPEPAAAWFARTVYGGRYFHAVVSNMPGPVERLTMADTAVDQVHPVLPVAPGAPLSVGALSWSGVLEVGIATDPAWLDAHELAAQVHAAAVRLGLWTPGEAPAAPESPVGPGEGEEQARTFAR